MNILITGITGNFGYAVYRGLRRRSDLRLYAGARNPERVNFLIEDPAVEARRFDFLDPSTFKKVLEGIDALILVRPPSLSQLRRSIFPLIDACVRAGIGHILFLSLQGAERNLLVPHHRIEKYIRKSGIAYTFLRPGFFMENLITTHRDEIKYRSELIIPAGEGRTSFVAVDDIAAAAVQCVGTAAHLNRAYEITGGNTFSYYDVAEMLSEETGRMISYRDPGFLEIFRYRRELGDSPGFILVMALIYRNVKKGKAAKVGNTLGEVFGISPVELEEFIRSRAESFSP